MSYGYFQSGRHFHEMFRESGSLCVKQEKVVLFTYIKRCNSLRNEFKLLLWVLRPRKILEKHRTNVPLNHLLVLNVKNEIPGRMFSSRKLRNWNDVYFPSCNLAFSPNVTNSVKKLHSYLKRWILELYIFHFIKKMSGLTEKQGT